MRSSATLRELTVSVGPGAGRGAPGAYPVRLVNDAANPLREGYPRPITSYTWRNDDPWNGLDGKVWFNEVPEDTRWTNYASPNAQDYYGVDFAVPTPVSDLRWYGYDDGGGVRPAADYRVQYWTGSAWVDVADQQRSSTPPVGNGLNRITFPPVTTTQVRLLFTNPPGAYVGVTELQSWSPSSRDAAVTVGPTNGNGAVPVDGPTPVTVTVRNMTQHRLTRATVALAVPNGWTAEAVGNPGLKGHGAITPGGSAVWRFVVTPPAGAPAGTVTDLVATATFAEKHGRRLSTHTRQVLTIAFPPGQRDPVGTWALDENSGTVAHDTSGAGHDVALTGGPAWVPGKSGSALQFDGASQYGQTSGPVVDTAGNFSVAAWVKLDSTGHFATAVSQDGVTTSGFFLQYSAADNRFAFATGEGRALSDRAPDLGQWYHLVGVHDANAGTYTLFLNGQPQAKVLTQPSGDAASGLLAIGRGFSGGRNSDFWPGAIDQVHVWNRPLSGADVAQLYQSGN
ncbi:MAG: discoidin domain-containing protein [Actinomycetota bacterium]|nr:discoidin domain-containing protein [Actinomycetota bacterium]